MGCISLLLIYMSREEENEFSNSAFFLFKYEFLINSYALDLTDREVKRSMGVTRG